MRGLLSANVTTVAKAIGHQLQTEKRLLSESGSMCWMTYRNVTSMWPKVEPPSVLQSDSQLLKLHSRLNKQLENPYLNRHARKCGGGTVANAYFVNQNTTLSSTTSSPFQKGVPHRSRTFNSCAKPAISRNISESEIG